MGIEVQGDNPNLWLSCNNFSAPLAFDIGVTGAGFRLGTLGNIGDCGGQRDEIAANFFTDCSTGSSQNIYWDIPGGADPNSGFTYSPYPTLSPDEECVSTQVLLDPCFGRVFNPSFACPIRPSSGLAAPVTPVFDNPTGIAEKVSNNATIRALLNQLPAQEVAELLGINTEDDLKLYIATMVDVGELAEAKTKLALLKADGNSDADNTQFVILFELLIELQENNIAWQYMTEAKLNTVKGIAYTQEGQSTLAAQAVYTAVTGENFIPKVSPIVYPTTPPALPQQANSTDFGNITLYPNPTSEVVEIILKGDVVVRAIQITDALGRVVWRKEKVDEKTRTFKIQTGEFVSGIYAVTFFEFGGKQQTKQLVISH